VILREGLLDTPRQWKFLGHVITRWGSLTGGTEKGFMDFLTLVDEGQRQEDSVFAPKQKEKREL
jgi:hypothetical protein